MGGQREQSRRERRKIESSGVFMFNFVLCLFTLYHLHTHTHSLLLNLNPHEPSSRQKYESPHSTKRKDVVPNVPVLARIVLEPVARIELFVVCREPRQHEERGNDQRALVVRVLQVVRDSWNFQQPDELPGDVVDVNVVPDPVRRDGLVLQRRDDLILGVAELFLVDEEGEEDAEEDGDQVGEATGDHSCILHKDVVVGQDRHQVSVGVRRFQELHS